MAFAEILRGSKPSDVFRRYMDETPNETKTQVAFKFTDEFPDVDSVIFQINWHWAGPKSDKGDGIFNAEIVRVLTEAHYLKDLESGSDASSST
jgi:hypothetical protein